MNTEKGSVSITINAFINIEPYTCYMYMYVYCLRTSVQGVTTLALWVACNDIIIAYKIDAL